jgi:hypothetical protein
MVDKGGHPRSLVSSSHNATKPNVDASPFWRMGMALDSFRQATGSWLRMEMGGDELMQGWTRTRIGAQRRGRGWVWIGLSLVVDRQTKGGW